MSFTQTKATERILRRFIFITTVVFAVVAAAAFVVFVWFGLVFVCLFLFSKIPPSIVDECKSSSLSCAPVILSEVQGRSNWYQNVDCASD